MKKKIFIGALTLILTYSVAVGQSSLLNQTTNGLFQNVNDFVIKPNVMFNAVESKQIIVGGGVDNMGFESNATGGALLGYYHPSAIRWSVASMLDLGAAHNEQEESINKDGNLTGKSITYKNPVFSNYKGAIRLTFGLPDTMNLSAGLVTYFNGDSSTPLETTTIDHNANNAETVTIEKWVKNFNMLLGFPVGLEFSPSIYNFFEPIILVQETTRVNGGPANVDASHEETKDKKTSFMLYDKLTIQDLLPAPFGSETAFWLGIGNANLHDITELEQPAYAIDAAGSYGYKVNFSTQLGVSNLIDISVGEVQVRFKPMVYIDLMTGEHKSITFGTTIAANAGAYVPLGVLPMSLFFGVTPRLQFYTTTYGNEQTNNNNTITTKGESRALTTNVFWTGKIGTSILLHKNVGLDVTFNVNTEDKSLGLSAQMSIAL